MTVETDSNGRSADGKFSAGNRAACGHKRRQHMAVLRSVFTEAITPEDVANIVRTLVRLAVDGDVTAAKLVLDRACGKLSSADSEDPAESGLVTNATFEELGPVTMENLAEHKRRMIEELEDGTFDIEHERAIRMARYSRDGT